MEGKIYRIAKYLGFELVKDSGASEVLDYDTMFDDIQSEGIPYMDEDTVSYNIGYSYNGLNSGYNIEIVANDYEQKLKCYYKGYLVYSEEGGSLLTFIPNEIWENIVSDLYKTAEEKIRKRIEAIKKEEEQAVAELAQHELQKLRSKWGDIL